MHHRALHDLEQARAAGLADDDLGDVVGLREIDQIVGDAAADAGQCKRLAAERFGKPQGVREPIALCVGELQAAPCLDRERRPGCMDPVGQPLRVAHQPRSARIFADADQDALAGSPWPGNGVGLHMGEQLLVDALGGAAERELA